MQSDAIKDWMCLNESVDRVFLLTLLPTIYMQLLTVFLFLTHLRRKSGNRIPLTYLQRAKKVCQYQQRGRINGVLSNFMTGLN